MAAEKQAYRVHLKKRGERKAEVREVGLTAAQLQALQRGVKHPNARITKVEPVPPAEEG